MFMIYRRNQNYTWVCREVDDIIEGKALIEAESLAGEFHFYEEPVLVTHAEWGNQVQRIVSSGGVVESLPLDHSARFNWLLIPL